MGVFFKFWQMIMLCVIAVQLYVEDKWALSEKPTGSANGWFTPRTFHPSISSDWQPYCTTKATTPRP